MSACEAPVFEQLLGHMDAQEAAMVALKSLLHDIGSGVEDDDNERRRIFVRMDAATSLLQRLNSDYELLVEQVARKIPCPVEELSLRRLADALERDRPELAKGFRDSRRRLLRLQWQISRISATSAWILSERRRIRHAAFQYTSGLMDSERYDASGRNSLSPDSMRYGTRS
jgi:hypothetical protein